MVFALATARVAGRPTPIIKIEDQCYRLDQIAPELLSRTPERGLLNLFDDWAVSEARLIEEVARMSRGEHPAKPLAANFTADDFFAPLLYPRKIVCFGTNYHKDAKAPAFDRDNVVPTIFLKTPTTAVVGSGKTVRYPSQTRKFDWEVELCAVIGKRGKRVAAKDARSLIAGFMVGIDLSARDWQEHPKHPYKADLFAGKSFDDSCPQGPWIVPARFVDDKKLGLRLSLNGELKQNGNTKDMIWCLEEQLEAVTTHLTLEPGDVLFTGTPGGSGWKFGTFMKVGDKLVAEIDQLGKLEVEIMPDQDQPLEVLYAQPGPN